jgi:hypothetical protein
LLFVSWDVDDRVPLCHLGANNGLIVHQVGCTAVIVLGEETVIAFHLLLTAIPTSGITLKRIETTLRSTSLSWILLTVEDGDISTICQTDRVAKDIVAGDVRGVTTETFLLLLHSPLQRVYGADLEKHVDSLGIFRETTGRRMPLTCVLKQKASDQPARSWTVQLSTTALTALNKAEPVDGVRQLLLDSRLNGIAQNNQRITHGVITRVKWIFEDPSPGGFVIGLTADVGYINWEKPLTIIVWP